jgi:dihydroorotase
LVHGGVVSLSRLVELLSTGPARCLNLPGGSLAVGNPADVTIFDLDREVVIDPTGFLSKGRNTPFGGWTLRGAPVRTIVGGRRVEY